MNMSMGYGKADKNESVRLLNECIDAGYTFLDTASMYGMGHNENNSGGTVLDGRVDVIRQTCEDSLRRLQTDVIDLYYLHRLDPKIPIEESVGALSDLAREGKIKTIGLSETCAETTRRAHAVHPITAMQSEYSLWTRTPERKILSVCDELDITFVPFSPLARSFLTGISSNVTQVDEDDIRQSIARPRFEVENFNKNLELLEPYKKIAGEQNCSMAQLALAWILARHGKKMIPIPGTKDINHMHENAGAGDIILTDDVIQALDELINEDSVAGRRYTDALMASTDSERD